MSEDTRTPPRPSRIRRTSEAARFGLDVMLSEAAAGGAPRFLAPGSAVKVGAGLARHPRRVAERTSNLTAELRHVAAGRSQLAPAKGDRRFSDPAWEGNWLFRRLLQSYLALGETVDGLVSDAHVDWRAERRARLAAGNVLDAIAPTNFPWSNPEVIKETVNTGGGNLVRGARRLARDLTTPPRLPATVDTSKFEVGRNLAVTSGSVVMRNEVPGELEVLGEPVDLGAVDIDTYFVAGLSDHIVPWESAYKGARLFGGNRRFVLSRSGHIQALVNPPGPESRSSFRVADDVSAEPDDFLGRAPQLQGSWWLDWDIWLTERGGELKRAPRTLGNRKYRAQSKAPGVYVLAS